MHDGLASCHLQIVPIYPEPGGSGDDVLPNAPGDEPGVRDMAMLLHDFGGDAWDIVWLDDGQLAARRRHGLSRPDGPYTVFASTAAEMHTLLSFAQ